MSHSSVFKALADSTRRQILARLKAGPLTAGQIAEGFAMSKPSISHHLSLLKSADLVVSEKEGQFLIYSLNLSVFDEVAAAMFELFAAPAAAAPVGAPQPGAATRKGASHEA